MPEAAKWLALELGILAALIPGIITIVQWRRRRRLVQALEALSRHIKQAENERRRTLTGILAGTHQLQEAQSAEAANSLILSERGFFRQCFQVLLSQDPAAVENLSHNLYGVLDEYLRKCTTGEQRAAPPPDTDASLDEEHAELFDNLFGEEPSPQPIAEEPKEEPLDSPPPADEEIDWDAAFAELHEEETVLMPSIAPPPPSEPEPAADGFDQETMDLLLTAPEEEPPPEPEPEPEPPAEPEEPAAEEAVAENEEEDDIMAQWGAALAEQAEEPPEPPPAEPEPEPDSAIDLGWDDAFLEETLVIKPEQKAGGS